MDGGFIPGNHQDFDGFSMLFLLEAMARSKASNEVEAHNIVSSMRQPMVTVGFLRREGNDFLYSAFLVYDKSNYNGKKVVLVCNGYALGENYMWQVFVV